MQSDLCFVCLCVYAQASSQPYKTGLSGLAVHVARSKTYTTHTHIQKTFSRIPINMKHASMRAFIYYIHRDMLCRLWIVCFSSIGVPTCHHHAVHKNT